MSTSATHTQQHQLPEQPQAQIYRSRAVYSYKEVNANIICNIMYSFGIGGSKLA